MQNVRAFFRKTGDSKYLSHLDVMRCFTRAFKRSGLDVWYTQGFNTHIYLMFLSPLSLGFESVYEPVDFRLVSDDTVSEKDLIDRLNAGLPKGIEVFAAGTPKYEHTEIAFSEWDISLTGDPDELCEGFSRFIDRDVITIKKKSKKGVEKEENAAEYIKRISFVKNDGGIRINTILKSDTSSSLNPSLLVNTFLSESGIDAEISSVIRKKLLLKDLEIFT